jgi:hypothetical protein
VTSHAFLGDPGDAAGAVKRYDHKTKAMGSTLAKLHEKSPKVS